MNKYFRSILIVIPVLLIIAVSHATVSAFGSSQAGIVASEISAFSNILSKVPKAAIDLSKVSGEYCMKVDIGNNGHMSHYAIRPENTKEDIIDFVNAVQLIEAGLDVKKLPRHPGKLGGMKSGQWYYLPKGEIEPHHGIKFPFPVIVKAINVVD